MHITPEGRRSGSLEHALGNVPAGSTITLGAGTFLLRYPIALKAGLRLVGEEGTLLLGDSHQPLFRLEGEGQTYEFERLRFEGGGGVDWGGAFLCPNANTIHFDLCRFAGNRARTSGGVALLRRGRVTFTRCAFERNRADRGGALDVGRGANVTVDRCVFVGQEADIGGAVFLNDTGAILIKSSTFVDNKARHAEAPGGQAFFAFGAGKVEPKAFIVNSLIVGVAALFSDGPGLYDLSIQSSVLPLDAFAGCHFEDAGRNVLANPVLTRASGFPELAPMEPGTGLADRKHIPEGATDLLGRQLVRDGFADVGAIARE
jgi:hypothetical protein